MTIFKHFPIYSYSKFIFNNPYACKKQKIEALNFFLNSTRESSKISIKKPNQMSKSSSVITNAAK